VHDATDDPYADSGVACGKAQVSCHSLWWQICSGTKHPLLRSEKYALSAVVQLHSPFVVV
jgi:hypothetical protein